MEHTISFNFGENTKAPAIVDKPGFFVSLKNISPEDYQLRGIEPRLQTHNPGERITNIATTFEAKSRFADVFAFGYSSVFRLDAAGTALIYTATQSSNDNWAVVPWRSEIYFTRLGDHLRKVAGTTSDEVPVTTSVATASNQITLRLSAKYAVAAHDHLWLGHVQQNGTLEPNAVRWSDLYNPDKWEVSETSESDRFSLSVNDQEITGLEVHHNKVLIFTNNSIWTATYEGLPTVYSFEPLYANIGCGYHYSAVKVGEDIFFISSEGVYKLSGFALTPIGDEIWGTLSSDLRLLTSAPAAVDERKGIIYWNVGTKTYVYNYTENRWAIFDFNFCNCIKYIPGNLARSLVINQINTLINDWNTVIDAGVNTTPITQTAYMAHGTVVSQHGAGTVPTHAVSFELPYFFLDSVYTEKELSQVRIAHVATGAPTITLTVSMKDSLNGTPRTETATLITDANFANESIFQIRNNKYGKLISLKISYTNTSTNYISQFVGVSLDFTNGKPKK